MKLKSLLVLLLFIAFSSSLFARIDRFTLPSGYIFKMIYVVGGDFTMGCTSEQSDCEDDESPAHQVTLSSYFIGQYEVTQRLWQEVMGTDVYDQRDKSDVNWPISGAHNEFPMYYISYVECLEFCDSLNIILQDQLPAGYKFTIPTEAQWEFAARGGRRGASTQFSGSDNIDEVAWYADNAKMAVKRIGTKKANEILIYDMTGNVWEWCSDWHSETYYSDSPKQNPENTEAGGSRVYRGGSWYTHEERCRVSYRYSCDPELRLDIVGLRLALVKL